MRLGTTFLVLVYIFCSPVYADKVILLEEINRPSMIDIVGERLFIMDIEKVVVYSLKDFRFLKRFGKRGQGPGEYCLSPDMPLRILAHENFLEVESLNKLLFFSHDGEFKNEIRKLPFINIIQPVGDHFVGRRIINTNDNSTSTSSVRIYDQNMREIKKIFSQCFIQQGGFPNLRLKLEKDFLIFKVWKDRIYVDESARGPFITVFNAQGDKLYDIKVPYEKIPISSEYKARAIADLEKDPHVLWQLKVNKISWKEFSQFFKYEFAKCYPAIQTMDISDNRIYVKTFQVRDKKNKYIEMDLKGNVLRTLFLKPTTKKWIMSTMMGVDLEIIRRGKIYFVRENNDEEWELHIREING